jgi:hypothetical protein
VLSLRSGVLLVMHHNEVSRQYKAWKDRGLGGLELAICQSIRTSREVKSEREVVID